MSTRDLNWNANSLNEIYAARFFTTNEAEQYTATRKKPPRAKAEDVSVAKRLRALIDAIPGYVVVLDKQGRVAEYNAAVPELMGERIEGTLWRDVIAEIFLPNLDQGELQTKDGRQFSLSTQPLGYEPGQILLLTDVTQTRQLQKAAQHNVNLINMGKMIASLAHQIRTPLSSSLLYLSQLAEGNLTPEKARKFTEKALGRTKHIEKMINDMLMFSHGGQFKMSEFKLVDVFTELSEQVLPLYQVAFAQLKIKNFDQSITLNGNKTALVGALSNLCMNALQQDAKDLIVVITISTTENGMIQIAVQDNAGGMDEKTLHHLFDPFYTTKSDGTGLGLAVVKSVIESHQGQIAVNSKLGEGTVFVMVLPSQFTAKQQVSSIKES